MTRAKDISKIVTDADLSGTLDVAGTMTVGGNVGIGTSSPSSYSSTTLEVKGSSTTSAIKMTNSTTGGGDAVGFDFEMNSNDMNFVNRTSSGVQKFWTNATERMRITSSGNVGIGTSSPIADIHILGSTGLRIVNSDDTTNLALLNFDNNESPALRLYSNDTTTVTIHSEGDSFFNGGNVGIGVSPSHKLEVHSANATNIVAKSTNGNGGYLNYSGLSSTGTTTFSVSHNGRVFAEDGIQFDSSGEVLDSYEEGNWTPTYTSTGASFSYTNQFGYYTKIGSFVHAQFYLLASISGTTSNSVTVTNLPFVTANISSVAETAGSVWFSGTDNITPLTNNNSSVIIFYKNGSTSVLLGADMNNKYLVGSVFYRAS